MSVAQACRIRRSQRIRGFTVIELMIVVTIIGVLAAIAIPAFDELIKNNRRTVVVNELITSLMLARAEAAKSGRSAILCGFDDANDNDAADSTELDCSESLDWSDGWIVSADDDRDVTVDATDGNGTHDAGELVLRTFAVDYPDVTVKASGITNAGPTAGVLVLRAFNATSTGALLTICDKRGASKARAVIIVGTGRSRSSEKKEDGSALACP